MYNLMYHWIFNVVGMFFCHLVQIHDIVDSIKYQEIKNLKLVAFARNLIMGRGWIFY